MKELGSVAEHWKSAELSEGLEQLEILWEKIPEPKTETANSYMVIEYGVGFALRAGEFNEAQKWASRATPAFAEKRHDIGEVEFLVGKVAFERGDLEVAKEKFAVAHKKSRGRVFQGEDPKYGALLKRS